MAGAGQQAVGSSPGSGTMRAVVQSVYGTADVLRLAEVACPTVGDGDALVRVHAASVCRGDVHLLTGKPYLLRLAGYGLLRPRRRVPGQNVAGRVVAVGSGVGDLRPGDAVFGEVPGGGFAEMVSARAALWAPKPANLDFAQAAAVPVSGMTALQGLRDIGRLRPGQRVLVNGASGGVGTYAVQIAKAMGAEVTAVCSTRHVALVRDIGADDVVDYTREDFAERGRRYNVILDLVGSRPVGVCRRVLERDGVLVSAGAPGGDWLGPLPRMLMVAAVGAVSTQTMRPLVATPRRADLLELTRLIEAGAVRPVIERHFALGEVAEALRHVAAGHAQGTSVVRVTADA